MNQEYKKFAIRLAKKAGVIIKWNFVLGMETETKSDLTPVTKSDKEINSLVISAVKKHYPDHNIQGEEESFVENNSKYLWVCDPIDGTIPFSHGIPICSFSLALVVDGEPILGVTHNPFLDRMFYAEKGKGAYLNDKKIVVSKKISVKNEIVDSDCWKHAVYNTFKMEDKLIDDDARVYTGFCAVFGCEMVACGEFVATIFAGNTAHDIAAVKVIVEEAGGRVTDLFGKEQRYDQKIKGAIVSNGLSHSYLVGLAKKYVKINKDI